jgi:hypothetical protein
VRYTLLARIAFGSLLIAAAPASAQTNISYSAPTEFMELFFDFTGSDEPGYPSGQPTLGQMLTQSVIAKETAGHAPGPLILVMGSDIYVYDSSGGARLAHERFRADRTSGFYELTAISQLRSRSERQRREHAGPQLSWRSGLRESNDLARPGASHRPSPGPLAAGSPPPGAGRPSRYQVTDRRRPCVRTLS